MLFSFDMQYWIYIEFVIAYRIFSLYSNPPGYLKISRAFNMRKPMDIYGGYTEN